MRFVRLPGSAPFTIAARSGHHITISDDERYEVYASDGHLGHPGPEAGDKLRVTKNPHPRPDHMELIHVTIEGGCGCEFMLRPLDDGER
jgi:hypothetical protein